MGWTVTAHPGWMLSEPLTGTGNGTYKKLQSANAGVNLGVNRICFPQSRSGGVKTCGHSVFRLNRHETPLTAIRRNGFPLCGCRLSVRLKNSGGTQHIGSGSATGSATPNLWWSLAGQIRPIGRIGLYGIRPPRNPLCPAEKKIGCGIRSSDPGK